MGLKESGLRGSLRSTSSVLPAFFDVTITNTNSPVQEGDILTVDYSADNTGDAQDMQDIRLEIDSVQEDVDPDVMLAGGASTTGTLEWDTTGEPEAEYTATVLSDDDSDSVMVEIGTAIPDAVEQHADHYWIYDEGDGNLAGQADGFGTVDINLDSGVTWTSVDVGDWGHGGFRTEYDGTVAEVSDSQFAINQENVSYGTWVELQSGGSNEAFAVGGDVSSTDDDIDNGWRIESRDGSIFFDLRNDGGGGGNVSFDNVELNKRYFVGIALDGGNMDAYVWDSEQNVFDESISGSRGTQTDANFRIGAFGSLPEFYRYEMLSAESTLNKSDFEDIWNDTK